METERVRTFVAVDLETAAHAALVRLKAELARAGGDVRWVRDDGLHATMKFLGSVAAARLGDVRSAVARAVSSLARFTMRVRGLGAFPSIERPRVLWVGIDAPPLIDLARAVDGALVALGFPPEARPFHPHITLGRVRGHRGWNVLARAIERHWNDDFGVSSVDRVTVYRSELRRGGSIYSPLWTTSLSDSTKGADYGA
ncbi:MAG TPA: RNA 2',3'-cyclic phosphodiesterase [Candidatus Binatia bacterium]|nr:RNA 2',3'-cyclic phosphodiesterase [Candidatus Binatia bacterium]